MSLEVEVNLNSLKMVQGEVENGITHSATEFEAFLADQQKTEHLVAATHSIAQIGGTFRLLEYPGAALIADEMAQLLGVIADETRKTTNSMLDAVTHAYFVLPRYIEYITIQQKALPTLIIPYVNEMRISRKEKLLPEYHFYQGSFSVSGQLPQSKNAIQLELLLSNAKGLNRMFQTGLIGLIREPNNAIHFQYVSRAVKRVVRLMGNDPNVELLQLASAVLECFSAGKLELTLNRKRNLSEIEKFLRMIVNKGEAGLQDLHSDEIKRELLFMLMLVNSDDPDVVAIRQVYSLPTLNTTDEDIVKRRDIMQGPSQDTLQTVTSVIQEELRNIKDILEISSQNESIDDEELIVLKDVIVRVSDTLSILNLTGPKEILMNQITKMESNEQGSESLDVEDFQNIADVVLYVECALSSLSRREVTIETINHADDTARKEIVANNHLAEAQQLVIEEARSAISTVKRGISSYVDSNFDSAHIANVPSILDSVRGGLLVLNYSRAAAIIKSCSAFVVNYIKESNPQSQHHQLLETLADTLISLEYYLNELETNHRVNEKILDVAEESLSALGFSIEL
ncbi:MAG: hypothetical protein ACI92E_001168 [Oceanicoccus sp.]